MREGHAEDELRPIKLTPHYLKHPEGSVLIETGDTRVVCTATVDERLPSFLRSGKHGWITAEYGMLPRSTKVRGIREAAKGKLSARTQEIRRVIARSLRAVVDLAALGERTIWVDCDVIQADGGTRTASITGGFVSLVFALSKLQANGQLEKMPVTDYLAATSVGIVEGRRLLDLDYREDSSAAVDMNVAMTGSGSFVEVQATAEETAFPREDLDGLLELAAKGIRELIACQRDIVGQVLPI